MVLRPSPPGADDVAEGHSPGAESRASAKSAFGGAGDLGGSPLDLGGAVKGSRARWDPLHHEPPGRRRRGRRRR